MNRKISFNNVNSSSGVGNSSRGTIARVNLLTITVEVNCILDKVFYISGREFYPMVRILTLKELR